MVQDGHDGSHGGALHDLSSPLAAVALQECQPLMRGSFPMGKAVRFRLAHLAGKG